MGRTGMVTIEKPPNTSCEVASIHMLSTKEIKGLFIYASKKLATYHKNGSLFHLTEEDIVHTALEKTMSGERQWNPEKCSVYYYFLGVIKSLIYNEGQKNKHPKEQHNTEITECQLVTLYTDTTNTTLDALINENEVGKVLDLVKRTKPELLPLIQTMYKERTSKPKVLAELLNKNVATIYTEKKQLLRLCQNNLEGELN